MLSPTAVIAVMKPAWLQLLRIGGAAGWGQCSVSPAVTGPDSVPLLRASHSGYMRFPPLLPALRDMLAPRLTHCAPDAEDQVGHKAAEEDAEA